MANDNVDIITFPAGGLNSDDDLLVIPREDARFRENVVISDDGNFNVFTNVRGNVLKGGGGYPAGNLRVIGFVENKEDKSGIFFIYSDAGEHSIVQYYSELDALKYILRGGSSVSPPIGIGDILNFDINHFVVSGIVGNEENKYLVWTDGYNEPRLINIQLARNYTYGGTPAYNSITEQIIRFYKQPVFNNINLLYQDTNLTVNNLRGKIWQFAIRTKFIDGTFSVLSPYSKVEVPNQEEDTFGVFTSQPKNNQFQIKFTDPNDDLVDTYQLIYRMTDIGSGAVGNWYLSNLEPTYSSGSVIFFFVNDGTGLTVSQDDANRIFDYVPDLADHLFVVDSNRVFFGGITEGYENIPKDDLDVTFDHNYNEASDHGVIESLIYNEDINASATRMDMYTTKGTFDDYHYSILITSTGSVYDLFDIVGTYGQTGTEAAERIAGYINSYVSSIVATNTADRVDITNNTVNTITVFMFVVEPYTKYKSFKCGSKQYFGLQYFKDGKPWFIQANSTFNIEVPYQSDAVSVYTGTHTYLSGADLVDNTKSWETDELVGMRVDNITDGSSGTVTANTSDTVTAALSGGTDNDWDSGDQYTVGFPYFTFYNSIDWEIDHLPPDGATHYQWAYLGSNLGEYNYYYVDGNDDVSFDGSYTVISKDIISNFVDAYGGEINYGFDIQAGDRIRFVGRFTSVTTQAAEGIELYDELYDYEILSVGASDIKLKNIDGIINFNNARLCIEIYRTSTVSEESGIYQAVSPIFEIYDDSGTMRHRGDSQDQTSSLPATGEFNSYFADCFLIRSSFVNNSNIENYTTYQQAYAWMESYPMSVMYDSRVNYFGKPSIINESARQEYFNKLRWGGKYLDESGVNFMTKFEYDDEQVLDDRNGRIHKIQQIGDTLKVYQERMITSFYLKTTSSTDADGTNTYVFSDTVISAARQSVFEYGCSHYSSYVKNVRDGFFFDIINSCVVRDTPGGPVNISDLKMHSYFKEKVKQIIEFGVSSVLILGGFDEDLDMYLITFFVPSNPSHEINDTLGFYLPANRWISFYSYLPEFYGKISGNTAIAFSDGQLYLQNDSDTRNNFFGVQYESTIDVHANGAPNQVKVYESIDNISTGRWSSGQDGDIEINIPELMQSRLVEGRFKLQEGVYRSDFLRDALVKDGVGGTTFEKGQLQTGRFLRGHEMRIRLRNDDTTEANLRMVTVKSNISQ